MSSRQKNYHQIFMSHRSLSPSVDNVTKALVNVLEYARGPVLEAFPGLCGIEISAPLESYELALHEGSHLTSYGRKKKHLVDIDAGVTNCSWG